jgi:proteasome component ECM29
MASPAPTEAEELAALNKALTALGFTDDVKLERFLHVLMPRVIDQMASKHESTKRKVLEILSHVNKRLKAVPAMPLPLEDLTALYVNEERPPTVRNFALIYVEQAHARAAPEARAAQILPLLKGISARPRQAADIICRLAITALAVPEKQVRTAVDDMEFMTNANDRAVFLRHALLYLMYQPNTVGHAPIAAPAPSPAEQAMRGVANVAGVPAPPTNNATESTAAPPQPPAAPPRHVPVLRRAHPRSQRARHYPSRTSPPVSSRCSSFSTERRTPRFPRLRR